MRAGDDLIRAGQVTGAGAGTRLHDVSLYDRAGGRLVAIVTAERARPAEGGWRLEEVERFDVVSKQLETVMDVNAHLGAGHTLWQAHSSDDDTVHSATVRNADYQPLGCMTYQEDISKFTYYPAQGEYDECQIDRSGDWLVIKEDVDGVDGEDNRIIGVHTGEERVLLDRDGAGGGRGPAPQELAIKPEVIAPGAPVWARQVRWLNCRPPE